MPLLVPLSALLVVLAGAGLVKVARPASGAAAVDELLPRVLTDRRGGATAAVQAIGVAEVAVAVGGLLGTTVVAGALCAAWYAALLAAAWRLRRVAPTVPCGCAGGDAPVSPAHLALDGVAVLVGAAAALLRPASVLHGLSPAHPHGPAIAVLTLVLAGLLVAALAAPLSRPAPERPTVPLFSTTGGA
jgi:hypothetical protein